MHFDILTKIQQEALKGLADALEETDFYMAGGTSLAMQIGHRLSTDFDWFAPAVGEPEGLFARLDRFGIVYQVLSVDFETVYIDVNSVQASFIGYRYPLPRPFENGPFRIRPPSTDDIACMKLSAVASRGSRKDFIDLHCLIEQFRSLEDYLRLYSKKFASRDFGHLLRSLVYFRDAESEPEVSTLKPFDWQKMKTDFERWVADFMARYR